MLYDKEPFTENIFESEEDEIPYDLPDMAPPEKIDKQTQQLLLHPDGTSDIGFPFRILVRFESTCLEKRRLREDQEEKNKSKKAYCFHDAHGDDHEHQSLAFTLGKGPASAGPNQTLYPGTEKLSQTAGKSDPQQRAGMVGRDGIGARNKGRKTDEHENKPVDRL
jgi:hypothetical protein